MVKCDGLSTSAMVQSVLAAVGCMSLLVLVTVVRRGDGVIRGIGAQERGKRSSLDNGGLALAAAPVVILLVEAVQLWDIILSSTTSANAKPWVVVEVINCFFAGRSFFAEVFRVGILPNLTEAARQTGALWPENSQPNNRAVAVIAIKDACCDAATAWIVMMLTLHVRIVQITFRGIACISSDSCDITGGVALWIPLVVLALLVNVIAPTCGLVKLVLWRSHQKTTYVQTGPLQRRRRTLLLAASLIPCEPWLPWQLGGNCLAVAGFEAIIAFNGNERARWLSLALVQFAFFLELLVLIWPRWLLDAPLLRLNTALRVSLLAIVSLSHPAGHHFYSDDHDVVWPWPLLIIFIAVRSLQGLFAWISDGSAAHMMRVPATVLRNLGMKPPPKIEFFKAGAVFDPSDSGMQNKTPDQPTSISSTTAPGTTSNGTGSNDLECFGNDVTAAKAIPAAASLDTSLDSVSVSSRDSPPRKRTLKTGGSGSSLGSKGSERGRLIFKAGTVFDPSELSPAASNVDGPSSDPSSDESNSEREPSKTGSQILELNSPRKRGKSSNGSANSLHSGGFLSEETTITVTAAVPPAKVRGGPLFDLARDLSQVSLFFMLSDPAKFSHFCSSLSQDERDCLIAASELVTSRLLTCREPDGRPLSSDRLTSISPATPVFDANNDVEIRRNSADLLSGAISQDILSRRTLTVLSENSSGSCDKRSKDERRDWVAPLPLLENDVADRTNSGRRMSGKKKEDPMLTKKWLLDHFVPAANATDAFDALPLGASLDGLPLGASAVTQNQSYENIISNAPSAGGRKHRFRSSDSIVWRHKVDSTSAENFLKVNARQESKAMSSVSDASDQKSCSDVGSTCTPRTDLESSNDESNAAALPRKHLEADFANEPSGPLEAMVNQQGGYMTNKLSNHRVPKMRPEDLLPTIEASRTMNINNPPKHDADSRLNSDLIASKDLVVTNTPFVLSSVPQKRPPLEAPVSAAPSSVLEKTAPAFFLPHVLLDIENSQTPYPQTAWTPNSNSRTDASPLLPEIYRGLLAVAPPNSLLQLFNERFMKRQAQAFSAANAHSSLAPPDPSPYAVTPENIEISTVTVTPAVATNAEALSPNVQTVKGASSQEDLGNLDALSSHSGVSSSHPGSRNSERTHTGGASNLSGSGSLRSPHSAASSSAASSRETVQTADLLQIALNGRCFRDTHCGPTATAEAGAEERAYPRTKSFDIGRFSTQSGDQERAYRRTKSFDIGRFSSQSGDQDNFLGTVQPFAQDEQWKPRSVKDSSPKSPKSPKRPATKPGASTKSGGQYDYEGAKARLEAAMQKITTHSGPVESWPGGASALCTNQGDSAGDNAAPKDVVTTEASKFNTLYSDDGPEGSQCMAQVKMRTAKTHDPITGAQETADTQAASPQWTAWKARKEQKREMAQTKYGDWLRGMADSYAGQGQLAKPNK